jgi:LuxR family glucitol operon transcriptional activator
MTTSNKNAAFGNLLKGAISGIANYEGKTAPVIEEELGALIGVSGKTIQRYKTGYLPPFERDNDAVRVLAEAAVRRGFLGREWLERFLHAARYPAAEKLLNELCPVSAPPHAKPDRVYQNLPAPTYSHFVMRQQAFAEVVDGLSQRSAAVLIVGLGGNGKTSMAREVAAHCLQDEGDAPRFDAVVWVSDKENPGTTNQSTVLDTIARTLDYPGFTQFAHDEKQYEVEQLLRRQKVLLIIDNAETITDGALFTWLLRLPEPSKAIITTREYQRAYRRGGWPVELRGMNEDEARTLLQQRLERLRIAHLVHDQTQLEPLLAATGGNPKAITMVAGLLKYERRPLQQIVDDLYAARGDLFDDLFSRAWDLLDKAAKRILVVMTFFPDSASGEALRIIADITGFNFDQEIEQLLNLSLLDIQQADLLCEPRYTLHPLVRAFAKARLAEHRDFERGARERWMQWHVELSSKVGWCWDDYTKLNLLEHEHEAAYNVLNWAFEHLYYSEALQVAKGIRYYYVVIGLWDRSLSVYLKGADAAKEMADTDTETILLSVAIQMLGRQENLRKIEKLLPRLRSLVDLDSVSRNAVALFEYHCALAWYHMALQEFNAAENDFRTGVHVAREASAIHRCIGAMWLGFSLYKQQKIVEAKRFFQEAVQQAEKGAIDTEITLAQAHLARIEIDLGNIDVAESLLTDAIEEIYRARDRENIAIIQQICTYFYTILGNLTKARSTLVEAIDLFERMGMRRELAEAREELARLEAQMAEAAE